MRDTVTGAVASVVAGCICTIRAFSVVCLVGGVKGADVDVVFVVRVTLSCLSPSRVSGESPPSTTGAGAMVVISYGDASRTRNTETHYGHTRDEIRVYGRKVRAQRSRDPMVLKKCPEGILLACLEGL